MYTHREIYAIGMETMYGESAVYKYKIEQDMWVVKNLQQCFLGKKSKVFELISKILCSKMKNWKSLQPIKVNLTNDILLDLKNYCTTFVQVYI